MVAAAPAFGQPKPAAAAANQPLARTQFIADMDAEYRKMDADKNGQLTRIEIEQYQKLQAVAQASARNRAWFSQLDADKNGQLSPAEFGKMAVASQPPNATPVLSQTDLNRDGRVTLVEYRTAKLANFDRMDADKDGIVTVPEMKAAGLVK